MFFLLILVLLLFVIIGIVFHKRILNLVSIFTGTWLCILLLYSLRLSYLQSRLTNITVMYFLMVFFSFIIGYFFITIFYLPLYKKRELNKYSLVSYNIIFNDKFLLISFWIILISMLIQFVYSKGFPLLWILLNINKTYFDFGIPTFNGLILSYLIFYTTLLYIKLRKQFNIKHLIYLLIMFLIPLLLISRQVLITIVIQLIFCHLLIIGKIKFKKISLIALFGIIIFGFIGNIRTGLDSFLKVANLKTDTVNIFFAGFYWVYMYLTMGIANINNLFSNFSITEFGHGINMLRSYLPTIILDYLFPSSNINSLNFLVQINFNVSGYMTSPYLDFGIAGLTLYTLFLGMLSSIIYHNFLFKRNIVSILIYVVILQVICMSFFTDFLLYLPVSFQIIWVIILRSRYLKHEQSLYENI